MAVAPARQPGQASSGVHHLGGGRARAVEKQEQVLQTEPEEIYGAFFGEEVVSFCPARA